MNIYTKTGDEGRTSLLGGKRVKKSCIEMQAIGEVDELNASIGVLLSLLDHEKFPGTKKYLELAQHRLFTIGSMIASVQTDLVKIPKLTDVDVQTLEHWIDTMNVRLAPLKQFILPGGTLASSQAFYVRGLCRRAEREIVGLSDHYELDPLLLQYINRLSDALFVLGRFINVKGGVKEVVWEK
jgi:cob(I)alamin adenosyltransferase